MRRITRNFRLGGVGIGSDHPISVQTMCNTRTADAGATLSQIAAVAAHGCDIIRVSVDTEADVGALRTICGESPLPVVADIQFSGETALAAVAAGVAGVRLNPGIIHDRGLLKRIAEAAVAAGTVIRVGANAGSLKPRSVEAGMARGLSRNEAVAAALVAAVEEQCAVLEKFGVTKIKAALKSSEIPVTLEAYRRFAARNDYPLHLGLTEAGTPDRGEINSAVCIGTLLNAGIGDTIRVSLTADPVREVEAAVKILEACGLRGGGVKLVSCPTCGRTEVDLIGLAEKVDQLLRSARRDGKPVRWRKIAVMGCPVNGPGEARDADLGIAGSRNGQLVIFRKGEVVGAYPETEGFAVFATMITAGDSVGE
ncbi:MAG: flavodoxin-dependent (E)-4-hydroxy-3-methylbut-2-enyl-diphosphate synthase [Lentisphaeria bacterium]|nr:flavodoxin-dependent (E)-4-hydroxy-3-methylbut-2-enyl-diphosphate synthase [Lentisphaeria bacterium]